MKTLGKIKKTQDNLFQLVKSLKQAEKRYFKVFASRHVIGDENNYVRLFEFIDKQDNYDKLKIVSAFANEKFIKNFPVAKRYLYQLILKSMRSYRADRTIDMQLKGLLSDVDFLTEKGLYQQASKILVKAKEMASDYEMEEHLLEVIKRERSMMSATELLIKDNIDEMVDEVQVILNKILNRFEYSNIYYQIFYQLVKKGKVRSRNDLNKIDKIMSVPLLKSEKSALSFHAKRSFYGIYAYYYWIKDDAENYYNYCKKSLALIEVYPKQLQVDAGNYSTLLYNFILAQIDLKKYKEALKNIKKIKKIIPQKDFHPVIFLNYSAELGVYLKTGEFNKGIPVVGEIRAALEKHKMKKIKQKIVLYDGISMIYFGAGNYSEALQWSNKILNSTEKLRESFYCYVILFNLLIHFELGNNDLLEYITKSTHRFLFTRKRLYQFETTVLNYIREMLRNQYNQKQLIDVFKKLKEELMEITKDPYEKRALDYFDFISWIESKITSHEKKLK